MGGRWRVPPLGLCATGGRFAPSGTNGRPCPTPARLRLETSTPRFGPAKPSLFGGAEVAVGSGVPAAMGRSTTRPPTVGAPFPRPAPRRRVVGSWAPGPARRSLSGGGEDPGANQVVANGRPRRSGGGGVANGDDQRGAECASLSQCTLDRQRVAGVGRQRRRPDDVALGDGGTYDPSSDTWRTMAATARPDPAGPTPRFGPEARYRLGGLGCTGDRWALSGPAATAVATTRPVVAGVRSRHRAPLRRGWGTARYGRVTG